MATAPQTCDTHTHGMMSVDDALDRLLRSAQAVTDVETVTIIESLGRTTASEIRSTIDVPGYDNSSMDGYALRSDDVPAPGTRLKVTQRIAAGSTGKPVTTGTAARIFTGAPVPAGADAVIMQENCEANGDDITVQQHVEPGLNIRPQGNDMTTGQVAVEAGIRIAPPHMSLMAGVGVNQISVFRKIRAAILYTGDEIIEPGQPLAPGQIYNSNRYALHGLLSALGVEITLDKHVEDNFEATRRAFKEASQQADLIISSGGVSVGGEDHVKPAIEAEGKLDLWKIAMKPGKPLAYGSIGDAIVFGLPGNPVSVFVTFLLFVRPYLLKMQGCTQFNTPSIPVKAGFNWGKPGVRREFARARLKINQQGELTAILFPRQGSDVSSSIAWAQGLVTIPENQTVKQGDTLQFTGFPELMSRF